jgi:hypothetical protein
VKIVVNDMIGPLQGKAIVERVPSFSDVASGKLYQPTTGLLLCSGRHTPVRMPPSTQATLRLDSLNCLKAVASLLVTEWSS